MNDSEMARQLTQNCTWWRNKDWELDDPDLRSLRQSALDYEPRPLEDLVPDGLYVLRGPRRVGKSVEVKRAIARLIHSGVDPRRILHFACDGLKARELRQLERVGRKQATLGVDGTRYWFLDEITSVAEWPDEIKWLRDGTDMRNDCLVLTGSSSRDLDEARKALAGRRGGATDSDRLLLPLSFRAFATQAYDGDIAQPAVIRARDFLEPECGAAVEELRPWLDDLASLWEVYCRCGGFPRAVTSQIETGSVDEAFVTAIWDVVSGDALNRGSINQTQALRLLDELSRSLASLINASDVGRSIGVGDHKTAQSRIDDLVMNYLAWPCHQRGQNDFPKLNAQSKTYFIDPLLSRLASLRLPNLSEPDTSAISEQQVGLHLVRQLADGDPARYNEFSSVMCAFNSSRKEVDFVGPELGELGFEGKYSDKGHDRESQTVRSMFNGRGVLATRATIGASSTDNAIFLPAAFVTYLLAE